MKHEEYNITNFPLTLTTSFGGSEKKILYAIQDGNQSANAPYKDFNLTKGVRMEIVDLADDEKVLIIEEVSPPANGSKYHIPAPAKNKWVDIRFNNTTGSVMVYLIELIENNQPDCSNPETFLTSNVATYLCDIDLNSKKELYIIYDTNNNPGLSMTTT
ncbi:MAG: hypothetical protein MI974_26405 [Chitinophagales bacterium]|nr:hypothetical protein [Chitinophagales bacterium]